MEKDIIQLINATLYELSNTTLANYTKKAIDDIRGSAYTAGITDKSDPEDSEKHLKKSRKRSYGVALAMRKAAGIAKVSDPKMTIKKKTPKDWPHFNL